MSISPFNEKDYALIEAEYAGLKEASARRCASKEELDVVQKAFEFANEAHKNVRRRSGEPYILHPIAVAKIVVSTIGLGYKSISAALLHDVVEDTDYTSEDIRNLFGEKIASLVEGLTKIKNVLDSENKTGMSNLSEESIQAENFKRILLTLNDDVRVVLIKLADRLHNCRTIEFMPEFKRDKILSETMFVFIPLAHRLGLYEVKSEMENIWLKYKEPDAYQDISAKIEEGQDEKEKQIDEFIQPINAALKDAGFDFFIRKRIKTPYSIWRKMQTKHVSFEQIYDLYALRIIFNTDSASKETERDQCYHIFSIITGLYRYKPERVRDWVKHPKSNGYEALHCTLMSHTGMWIEVQIRTKRMDDIAEKGIAAHWAYKKDGFVSENDSEMDKWLEQVKGILVNPDVNALELLDIIHNDLTSSEIVIFTPKGEQKTVLKGSTALDFAYQIHTEIGCHAIAAKVNMKLVPLSYVLRSGDQVEIISAEDGHPKREWLQFLVTRKARSEVMDFFKSQRDETIALGNRILSEQLTSLGYKPDNEVMRRLASSWRISENNLDEMYFRVGLGLIKMTNLTEILKDVGEKTKWYRSFFPHLGRSVQPSEQEENHPHYEIASCCHPIPGDPVIGIRETDGTIYVHKKTCSVADSMASKFGDRVVVPDWADIAPDTAFPVRISIQGLDRMGLLNEISRYISLVMGVNMRKIYLGVEEGIFEGYIDLYVQDKDALEKMIRKLGSIEGIQNVIRTEI